MVTRRSTGDIIQEIIDEISRAIETFLGYDMSLDEFAQKASQRIDRIILSEMKKGNSFHAGRFYIKLENDNIFKTSFELYFIESKKEYLQVCGDGKTVPMEWLRPEDQATLREKKQIPYEVNAPATSENTSDAPQENISTGSTSSLGILEKYAQQPSSDSTGVPPISNGSAGEASSSQKFGI